MSKYEITGSTIPMNLMVLYRFPFSVLSASTRYFTGNQNLELTDSETPGTPLEFPANFQFTDSVEEFQHIKVLLTYLHEQFHLRHLTASPLGLLLYFIGGRQYNCMYPSLKKWGERIGSSPATPIRLPLSENHADDPEIQEIKNIWTIFGAFHSLFMESVPDTTLLKASSAILIPLAEELKVVTANALGMSDTFPDIDVENAYNEPVNPAELSGRAVIEGLARMNEFMFLAYLNTPYHIINNYIADKQQKIYAQTSGIAGKLLNISSVDSWMFVSKISDWALQTPIMPFLLRGRKTVTIMELLPAWRYTLLVLNFKKMGFKVNDLFEREKEVASELFGKLRWEDPWRVADRILKAKLPVPKSAITRHYIENLQLGAQLRFSDPVVMSFPNLGDKGFRLQAIYNIFADKIYGGTTGKLKGDKDSWAIITSLVSDATMDALMLDDSLSRPLQYARLVSDFFKGRLKPGALLGQMLIQCLGKSGAKRVIDATGFGVD
jgi:hypothetical protein